jgi:hypothetical protein
MFCRSLFVLLPFFLLVIVLTGHLRFMNVDYPFGIFKLFLQKRNLTKMVNNSNHINKTNNLLKQLNNQKKIKYGVGNPGRGLETGKNMHLGLTSCMYFFFFIVFFDFK